MEEIIKINRGNHSKTDSLKVQHQESTSLVKTYQTTLKVRDVEPDNRDFWTKMRATLAKCSLMLGAKSAPTDEEYFILKDVMQEKFIDFGSEEVEIAFKQLIAGQLDCEPDKYGKISAAYLGQVLIAFRQKRHKAIAEAERNAPKEEKEPTLEEKKKIREEFLQNCLIKPYKEIKETGSFDVDKKTASMLFKLFRRARLINVTPIEEREYMNKAREDLKQEAQRNYKDHKPMLKLLEGLRNGDKKTEDKVVERACALFLIDQVLRLASNNRDIELIAKQL